MPNFEKVFIGDHTPITLEKINRMCENDVYMYDLLAPAPRGVLAWKNRTSNVASSQSASSATSQLSLDFSCEESRQIRVGISFSLVSVNVLPCTITISLFVDNKKVGGMDITQHLGYSAWEGKCMEIWLDEILTSGEHTLQLRVSNQQGATATITGTSTAPIQMWVEDYGAA